MSTTRATFYFLFSTFLWGLTFVFIKVALFTINPYTFIFYRFLLGAIFLLLINPALLKEVTVSVVRKSFILGLLLFGTVLFQTIGLKTVNASTASFITGTAIIYVVMLVAITTKTLPSFQNIIGSCLAIIGLGFVTLHHNNAIINVNCIWIVLCSLCFGLYIFFSKKIVQNTPIVSLTALQFLMIACFAMPLILLNHDSLSIPTSMKALTGIFYCGIFASGLAFTLQLKSQKTLSSQKASVLFAMEPIFATLAAFVVLHEQLNGQFLIGSGLILSSLAIIQ